MAARLASAAVLRSAPAVDGSASSPTGSPFPPLPIADGAASVPASVEATRRGRGRRRIRGEGRKASQSLRQPVTFAHKLGVIDFFEANGKDMSATMAHFYADLEPFLVPSRKRMIYRWAKERRAIEEMCFKSDTAAQTRRRGKGTATTLSAAAEQELVEWIRSHHHGGGARQQLREGEAKGDGEQEQEGRTPLSAQQFRAKAIEIAGKYGVPEGCFQATWTWQRGFLTRHQLTTLR